MINKWTCASAVRQHSSAKKIIGRLKTAPFLSLVFNQILKWTNFDNSWTHAKKATVTFSSPVTCGKFSHNLTTWYGFLAKPIRIIKQDKTEVFKNRPELPLTDNREKVNTSVFESTHPRITLFRRRKAPEVSLWHEKKKCGWWPRNIHWHTLEPFQLAIKERRFHSKI